MFRTNLFFEKYAWENTLRKICFGKYYCKYFEQICFSTTKLHLTSLIKAVLQAASILAKTYRDDLMKKLHLEHPQYQWENNKGYPTKSHRAAIKKIGVSQYHRKSFRLLPEQLSLNI